MTTCSLLLNEIVCEECKQISTMSPMEELSIHVTLDAGYKQTSTLSKAKGKEKLSLTHITKLPRVDSPSFFPIFHVLIVFVRTKKTPFVSHRWESLFAVLRSHSKCADRFEDFSSRL